uniref:Uncharacterized protein n=1 Tax=Romanomermis culicivorax TaxID=13658 RepID=A0A915JEM3_ROMCU
MTCLHFDGLLAIGGPTADFSFCRCIWYGAFSMLLENKTGKQNQQKNTQLSIDTIAISDIPPSARRNL